MQVKEVSSGSKFKMGRKMFWWVLGTVTAVPITKWVESQLSLSFFSPLISKLWDQIVSAADWLDLLVPMPLWTLFGITTVALLMTAGFLWAVLDANKQLNGADAELNAAHRKIAELSNPQLVSLNQDQQAVLSAIAQDEESDGTYISSLPQMTGLHRLVAEGALDVLLDKQLVEVYPGGYGVRVGLVSAGRQYILHPKSPIQWLLKANTPQSM